MRHSVCVLILAALCGCQTAAPSRPAPAPQRNDSPAEDRDTTAAVLMAGNLQTMQRLAQAAPAEQAEIVASARGDFERNPQNSVQLRYALLLATPGHAARDPVMAQTLLRQLAAQPEALLPIERAVTLLELAELDREIGLKADNERLQTEAQRSDRDRVSAAQRRLQAEIDENAKLRRQLEEAQAKLDAIADIERNLTERKSSTEGHQP